MRPEDQDLSYLWDMREAARSVLRFVRGATPGSFAADELLRSAVERQLILLGEAARRVSAEFRTAHSELPWREMIGQRSVLIHDYGEVDAERIWLVAKDDLPTPVLQLDELLPPESDLV